MTTIGAVLLLSWVVISGLGTDLLAATPETSLVHGLANVSTQRATLEHLHSLADPTLQGVLQALKEGALYTWKDNLLIFTNDGVFVDLANKPLVDSAGQAILPEDGLEQVVLREENIPLVQRALTSLNSLPEPARRKSTALRLGNLQDPSLTPTLSRALAGETVAEVKAVLLDAVHKLRLLDLTRRCGDRR